MPPPRKFCQIIHLKPSRAAEYRALHAAAWPGVLACLAAHGVRNYLICYSGAPPHVLVGTFEYVGEDWAADARAIAEDAETRRWWALTDGMQESWVEGSAGSADPRGWWMDCEEVFWFSGEEAEGANA